ncbi:MULTISPECIES: autotransporter domain-containing protein [Stenotrophomonas]|uniref:Autotransporter domain-containing protein n=1 Tax=Stenotrophomonas indicatrix TaxID=2045451 RepID=A0ABT8QCY2_9GAMM|nr:autotransporter domain-containing protein [Stenotrophomonas indicatrix]OJH80929.1 MAG: autotransporter outer membrane beta-barrel domain-containing protein [Stenotrophomonas maltophilia]MDN8662471.1 autotransporter domain-containing protein [Stenotrophomonas indicatrix]MDN8669694.1 autotransporter domain-containing protein [Stenotrophomonas indicatrix]PII13037.1 autotransporter outer membrane beta-barrel domain-containing protein [Stenotrophomonas indicatrix]PJL08297.1 autotransporter outer
MTAATSYRSTSLRRSFLPSPLASAIVGSLLMAATLPALAQGNLDDLSRYQYQRSLQAAFAAPSQSAFAAPVAAVAMVAPPATTPETPVMGKAGDRASWRTSEFNRDWGLQAVNADAAYARGLTGAGIRLGVFDSGSGLDHDEFAGKDHRSLRIADLLLDGSRCTNTTLIDGPDACFASDGDDVSIDYVVYDDSVPQAIRDIIESDPRYQQAGIAFQTHGTHVAGTIAANRDGNGTHGVAFGADLTAAKLFFNSAQMWTDVGGGDYRVVTVGGVGPDGSAFESMYAQMNAQDVRAVNHSWGLTNEPTDLATQDQLYAANAEYLDIFAEGSRSKGMIQVWAAGNNNANAATPEAAPIAGIYATLPRLFADIEQNWLSVVNVRQDSAAGYMLDVSSNRCGYSANWCLAAPGTDILSTVYGADSALDAQLLQDSQGNVLLDVLERVPTYSYDLMTGTSMAAPHVTGALGLLFERFPYLDNAQVRDVLLTTATDLGAAGVDDVYGWGLMNLAKAIEGYGSLRVDTNVVMNQKAGGLKVWEGDAWDDWTNDIGGPGKLTKSGAGWLRLSGDNSFNGAVVREGVLELDGVNTLTSAVDVAGGTFLLNGTLKNTALNTQGGISRVNVSGVLDGSNLTINGGVLSFNGVQTGGTTFVGQKGTLKGVGQLGDTTVAGTIAPGNSIGTLTINGDYVQTETGVYQAEVAPGSRSDQLHVTGTATLGGTLVALPEPGIYYLGEQFNFIRADGGVNGQFAITDFSTFSPFMQFNLAYGATGARIEVTRGNSLASSANTANQHAVATVVDTLAINQGLPKPLTTLFPQQVGAALDSLSGELHAATSIALVEGSRHVRDAALSRRAGATSPGGDEAAATGVWVQAIGGSGTLDGNANTARTEANSNGLLMGVDRQFGGWQVGLLAGTGRTDVKQQDGRRAKSKIDNTHFGAYASHNWGGFGLRGGLAWSEHDIDSTRELAFAGYSDTLSARYDGRTRQAFIEAGYRFGGREAGLEPYLQVARVEVDMKSINERGGAAALQGDVDDSRTTLATAGVRFDKGLKASFQQDSWLHVRGGVGYRHASGDRNPMAKLGFASGGDTFAVSGAPIADSAVVAELGLSAWLTANQQLELGYTGQFGDESRDHGANLRWSVRF